VIRTILELISTHEVFFCLSGRCSTTGSNEGEGVRLIDKFNGENFNLWKFKIEMILAEKNKFVGDC